MFADAAITPEVVSKTYGIPPAYTLAIWAIGYVIGYLLLSRHKTKSEKELTAFKTNLEAKNQRELEAIKIEAEAIGAKQMANYPAQKELIEQTFAKLVALRNAAMNAGVLIISSPESQLHKEEFRRQFDEFHNFFPPKMVILPNAIGEKVIRVASLMAARLSQMEFVSQLSTMARPSNNSYDIQMAEIRQMEQEIEHLYKAIPEMFQDFLAINKKQPTGLAKVDS